jgi:hypothetical protein
VVRARLERHVDGCATRVLARCFERNDLGVRTALSLVPTLADDVTVGDDDCPDDRVRMGRPATVLGELQRAFEEARIHALILGGLGS